MADGGAISIRMSLKGAEQVRAELDKLGPSGAKAARELDRAMRAPGPGLLALNAGAKEARGGLDMLAGRAGPAGNVLSALGPAGLAAAAGIGAIGVVAGLAMHKLQDAMKIAADLTDTADRIGVSTTMLQAWGYAADEAGVPVEALHANLEKLNGVIGAFKIGIGDAKLKPVFEELGITKEQLSGVKDAEGMMLLLADSLGQIRDRAIQVKFARSLGIEESLPLLRLGSQGLRNLTDDAERLGLVMGQDVVSALDAADRKIEIAQQRIDMSLRLAVSGAADDFANLITEIAGVVSWLTRLNSMLERGVSTQLPSRSLYAYLDDTVRGRSGAEGDRARDEEIRRQPGWVTWLGINQQRRRELDADDARRYNLQTELGQLANGTGAYAPQRPGFEPQGHTARGGGGGQSQAEKDAEKRRREAEREVERLQREEVSVNRDWINALVAGKDTVESRAEAQRLLLQYDADQERVELDKAEAAIRAGGLMTEEVEARLEKVRTLREDVLRARQQQVEEKRAEEQRRAELDVARLHAEAQVAILQAASSLARTSDERRDIETQLLAISQQRQKAELENLIAAQNAGPLQDAYLAQLASLPKLFELQNRAMRRDTAGPVEAWWDRQQTEGQAQEWVTGEALDALDSLNDGLVEAWTSLEEGQNAFEALADVAVDALQQIEKALLKVAIQQMIIKPLASALFGDGQGGGSNPFGNFVSNLTSQFFGSGGFGSKTGGGVTVTGQKRMATAIGDMAMTKIAAPALPSMGAPVNMKASLGGLTIINNGEPVKATQSQDSQGRTVVTLDPVERMIEGKVAKMGADGSLMRTLQTTPQRRRRG